MNGYIAFYKGQKIEIFAETALQARDLAAKLLKVRKAHAVIVVLVEKAGEPVTHSTGEIG